MKSDGRALSEAITEAVATLPMGFMKIPNIEPKPPTQIAVDY
ncbi:MAG: hypothetical protein ACLRSW_10145 [Christensenellaceae bacterium]